MTLRESILAKIAAYIAQHNMSERAFGLAACGDHKLVPRMRQSGVTLDRVEKAEAYMADHPHGPPVQRIAAATEPQATP